jgi:hypothetical protein
MFNNENIKMKVRNITIVKINHWMIEIAYYGWNINKAKLGGFLTFKRTCKRCCYQNWYLWLIGRLVIWTFKSLVYCIGKIWWKTFLLWKTKVIRLKIKNSQTHQIIYCIVLDKSFIVLKKYSKEYWITSNHLLCRKNMVQDLFTMKDKNDFSFNFFLHVHTKREWRFELVTSAS